MLMQFDQSRELTGRRRAMWRLEMHDREAFRMALSAEILSRRRGKSLHQHFALPPTVELYGLDSERLAGSRAIATRIPMQVLLFDRLRLDTIEHQRCTAPEKSGHREGGPRLVAACIGLQLTITLWQVQQAGLPDRQVPPDRRRRLVE
jgi:hypothetical protein